MYGRGGQRIDSGLFARLPVAIPVERVMDQGGARRTVQGVLPVTSIVIGIYDVRPEDLPAEPAGEAETPATYHQARSGCYHSVWSAAEQKEVLVLAWVGTFVLVDP